MSHEQLDVLDLAISAFREAMDDLDRIMVILERFVEVVEQMDEKNILDRFR